MYPMANNDKKRGLFADNDTTVLIGVNLSVSHREPNYLKTQVFPNGVEAEFRDGKGEDWEDIAQIWNRPNRWDAGTFTRVVTIYDMDTLRGMAHFLESRQLNGSDELPLSAFTSFAPKMERVLNRTANVALERKTHEVFKAILGEMEAQLAVSRQLIAEGKTGFHDLAFYFHEGMEVVTRDHQGRLVGGTVLKTEYKESFWTGPKFEMQFEVFYNRRGQLRRGKKTAVIPGFGDIVDITSLPVRVATDADKATLSKRWDFMAQLSERPAYLQYKGLMTEPARYYGPPQTYKADGRVMLDTASYARFESDKEQNAFRSALTGERWGGEEENTASIDPSEVAPEDHWKCVPFIHGFSMAVKKWGEFDLDKVTEIDFQDNAFDLLVLDGTTKTLIQALVVHARDAGFTDIVSGKGGGCIFGLHGQPGTGKTLTAEAVAEILHRPLYSISVGELGTSPEAVEETLREVLELADLWNAVVLLDEADIFMERRTKDDILRNALVGVFLRLLEYHHGVLFLTTNRLADFDPAIKSRINISVNYPDLTDDARRQVWNNLLRFAKMEHLAPHVPDFMSHNMNGREIKSAIRLAKALAVSEGTQPEKRHVDTCIKQRNPTA